MQKPLRKAGNLHELKTFRKIWCGFDHPNFPNFYRPKRKFVNQAFSIAMYPQEAGFATTSKTNTDLTWPSSSTFHFPGKRWSKRLKRREPYHAGLKSSRNSTTGPFLPPEVLLLICEFLPWKQLSDIRLVSKTFDKLAAEVLFRYRQYTVRIDDRHGPRDFEVYQALQQHIRHVDISMTGADEKSHALIKTVLSTVLTKPRTQISMQFGLFDPDNDFINAILPLRNQLFALRIPNTMIGRYIQIINHITCLELFRPRHGPSLDVKSWEAISQLASLTTLSIDIGGVSGSIKFNSVSFNSSHWADVLDLLIVHSRYGKFSGLSSLTCQASEPFYTLR